MTASSEAPKWPVNPAVLAGSVMNESGDLACPIDAVATLPCLGYLALRGDCENIALATLLVSENAHTATSWSSRR